MRNVHPQDSAHHDLAPPISQEAAREMLKALKQVDALFGLNPFMMARREVRAEDLNRVIKLVREAGAKAEGRE